LPPLREKLNESLPDFIPIQNLHADNVVVHDIDDEVASSCIERYASVPSSVAALRSGRRVDRRAELVLASASVHESKGRHLRRQPGLGAVAQKILQLGTKRWKHFTDQH